ncbi:membrane protein [Emticicia aquatilis]|uniref:Membrane protein n=1 Tax=Emticicia aquatilis TaxID=1537369 RepID=A0A917DYR3_9BACT|nr:DedA family protein [Emticicia aquatilis]GGD80347.1 membrane protein [Emticicia aquatilis]
MEQISEWFKYLMNSEELIRTGGLITITLIIFIENGIIFGFFLPGDYLLFLSGVFCGTKLLNVPVSLLMFCVFAAAVLGSLLGYIIGRYFGDGIQTRPDSLFFKKKYIENTRKYFEKYGSQTLVIARFLPVIRTFSPILAGIVKMNIYKFMLYNILGGLIWTVVLVGGGFYFGEKFPWIVDYVQYIIFFFLGITTFTVIRGYLNAKKELSDM